jgi:hypothetical protein
MTSAQCQQTTKSIEIFNNWNLGGVDNSPSCNPSFTISQAHYITYIDTYHWNSGSGTAAGGTIGLRSDVGTEYGPWKVETKSGQGGVPNAWWIAHPDATIPAGTYTIIDSDPSTWSQNSESNGCGFSKVEGSSVGDNTSTPQAPSNTKVTQAPCGDGATELSIASPTDQYSAGPSLTPGSYKIWYATRTGTQIGQPDNWNTKTVELHDGEFYVFDVSTGDFSSTSPKMINPMLSNPTPGESEVWYKASTQYAHVVCFEGPLNSAYTKINGYDEFGFDKQGYDKNGYDKNGFDVDGNTIGSAEDYGVSNPSIQPEARSGGGYNWGNE